MYTINVNVNFLKVAYFTSTTQIYDMNNTSKEVNCTNVVSYKQFLSRDPITRRGTQLFPRQHQSRRWRCNSLVCLGFRNWQDQGGNIYFHENCICFV